MHGYTARITLIAALDRRNAIGRGGKLPWHLKADMDHFRDTTMNMDVVMGRKTYDSIPQKFRPLAGRRNWVVSSRSADSFASSCFVVRNPIDLLLKAGGREVFVMGGEQIYSAFLPYASRLILTHVETVVENADAFFPEIPQVGWEKATLFRCEADRENDFGFSICEYTKIKEEVAASGPASW